MMNKKRKRLKFAVVAAVVMAAGFNSTRVTFAQDATPGFNTKIPESVLTPNTVETMVGTLEFFDGPPTPSSKTSISIALCKPCLTECQLPILRLGGLVTSP